MGRPRKVVVSEGSEDVDVPEVAVAQPKVEKVSYTLKASFKSRDAEGDKILLSFDSTGEDVAALLKDLTFPKGVNALVNVTVTKDEKELSRALAPHKARAILEHKDEVAFWSVFRGL